MIPQIIFRASTRSSLAQSIRSISTLSSNPHIYIHPNHPSPNTHTLSLLPTSPPSQKLSIGTTTAIPPTPTSLTENPHFMRLVHEVLRKHAPYDPQVLGQAAAFASSSGANLGSGGSLFSGGGGNKWNASGNKKRRGVGDGAGGASSQGGAGGGGRGGWLHVSDARAPPDFGRIAWPEDIFGSLEVDGQGVFVEGEGERSGEVGNYQESGSYRVVTREGILGLSDFLRGKVVERLREEEEKEKAN